jgi:hypothetical protein
VSGLTDEQRARICAAARTYLGVRWSGQMRDHRGIDCVGLCENAYVEGAPELGLERTPATYRGIDSKVMMRVLRKNFRMIPFGEANPADLVVYRILPTREAHLVMLLPPRAAGWPMNAIHCPGNYRVVESLFDIRRFDIQGFHTWQ